MRPVDLPTLLRALRRLAAIALFVVIPGSTILVLLIWWLGHRRTLPQLVNRR